ncbi:MAG: hypothetical protein IPM08_00125 [Actinomycetales bacterium]|nr:hypothetical protein [Actinomycetales bacterium]
MTGSPPTHGGIRLEAPFKGDGHRLAPGEVVAPDERRSGEQDGARGWGAQHVVAMFGATFVFPILVGCPPSSRS